MVEYYQLAHNYRHPETKACAVEVIHNFGRADNLDRGALVRLCRSIARVAGLHVHDSLAEGEAAAPGHTDERVGEEQGPRAPEPVEQDDAVPQRSLDDLPRLDPKRLTIPRTVRKGSEGRPRVANFVGRAPRRRFARGPPKRASPRPPGGRRTRAPS